MCTNAGVTMHKWGRRGHEIFWPHEGWPSKYIYDFLKLEKLITIPFSPRIIYHSNDKSAIIVLSIRPQALTWPIGTPLFVHHEQQRPPPPTIILITIKNNTLHFSFHSLPLFWLVMKVSLPFDCVRWQMGGRGCEVALGPSK